MACPRQGAALARLQEAWLRLESGAVPKWEEGGGREALAANYATSFNSQNVRAHLLVLLVMLPIIMPIALLIILAISIIVIIMPMAVLVVAQSAQLPLVLSIVAVARHELCCVTIILLCLENHHSARVFR